MLKKLRIKFVVIIMAVISVMIITVFGLICHFTQADLERHSIEVVRILAERADQPGGPPQGVELPWFYFKINIWGEVMVQGTSQFDLQDQALLQTLIQEVYSSKQESGVLPERELRFCVKSGPGMQVMAFVDISGHKTAMHALIRTSFFMGAISLLVCFGISLLLARWAVRPVERAWEQQKQFVSDASHELKTPLTVILNNAELLQEPERSAEHQEQLASGIVIMSRQMKKLVESMLELARADNGQIKKDFAPLDLSSLVSDALLPYEPLLFERGMLLKAEIEENLRVMGNELYLGQVVDGLLDNVLKYSEPGTVSVCLRRQGRDCLLQITNPGAPIEKEALDKLFDRFYRANQARSRTGSFGLGLSIAESVIQEHGGKIWAENTEQGIRFSVQLPA